MKKIFTIALSLLCVQTLTAQVKGVKKIGKIGKVYMGVNMDGYILSSSKFERTGNLVGTEDASQITVPRFTVFPHIGTTAHYNFNRNFGLISGLGIKNLGFIQKVNNPDSTVIRRNLTIGIPLGLKFGDMFGTYGMIGGGVDIPFWYKEKGFVKRNDKDKFNEPFSQRTATVLPYVFVGARFHPGVFVKATYYPTNFMNPDFTETVNGAAVKPYEGYKVNLFMLSVGFDITYRPKYD